MKGKLFIVATPIGNLDDITFRALSVLKEVKLILCEDTRVTARLKTHFNILTPSKSYFEHNEHRRIPEALDLLQSGLDLALVSDAGTPTINDPGFKLIRACHDSQIEVISIPGACALVAALAASGFPTDRFEFAGFIPTKSGKREKVITAALNTPHTTIWYESPHRILKTLEVIESLNPSAMVFIARELTKKHEESIRGVVGTVLTSLRDRPGGPKGEFVLILNPVIKKSTSEVS